jgi:hypothetical protein
MKIGDRVRVYPKGDETRAAIATVAICSSRAAAVGFGDKPPFPVGDPLCLAVHPVYGLMMFVARETPMSPWLEAFRGDPFEIEEANC